MKVVSKTGKTKKAKAPQGTGPKTGLFIGVRKSGSEVTVTQEIIQRSPNGHIAIIRSTKSKLPKTSSSNGRKADPKNWMQDPQLGERLTNVFSKAVAAAKRRSDKLNG